MAAKIITAIMIALFAFLYVAPESLVIPVFAVLFALSAAFMVGVIIFSAYFFITN